MFLSWNQPSTFSESRVFQDGGATLDLGMRFAEVCDWFENGLGPPEELELTELETTPGKFQNRPDIPALEAGVFFRIRRTFIELVLIGEEMSVIWKKL